MCGLWTSIWEITRSAVQVTFLSTHIPTYISFHSGLANVHKTMTLGERKSKMMPINSLSTDVNVFSYIVVHDFCTKCLPICRFSCQKSCFEKSEIKFSIKKNPMKSARVQLILKLPIVTVFPLFCCFASLFLPNKADLKISVS